MRIFSQLFADNFESFDWLTADSEVLSPEREAGPPNGISAVMPILRKPGSETSGG